MTSRRNIGQQLEMDDYISPHVQVHEVACKCGCGFGTRYGDIDERVLSYFEEIRYCCGNKPIPINSGARCPDWNAKVNGAPNSPHLDGKALDLDPCYNHNGIPSRPDVIAIACEVVGNGGVGWTAYANIIHIDSRTTPPRRRW